MCNNFVEMFKRHGWEVMDLGGNNYIGYTDMYFVPFSLNHDGTAAAVSFLRCNESDIETFIQRWRNYSQVYRLTPGIGMYAFMMYQCDRRASEVYMKFGNIYNHDHSCYEMESWISRMSMKRSVNA